MWTPATTCRGASWVGHVAVAPGSLIGQDNGRIHLKRALYIDRLTSLKCGIYHEDVETKEPQRFLFFVAESG